jgi:adenylate kinase
VIALDVAEDEIVARLSRGRFETDGSRLVARADDRPEIVRERLSAYREQTAPLLGFFASRGLLLRLDGRGEPTALCDEIVVAIGVAGRGSLIA